MNKLEGAVVCCTSELIDVHIFAYEIRSRPGFPDSRPRHTCYYYVMLSRDHRQECGPSDCPNI